MYVRVESVNYWGVICNVESDALVAPKLLASLVILKKKTPFSSLPPT